MTKSQTKPTSAETQVKEWEAYLEGLRGKLSNLKNRAERLSGETKLKYLEQLQTLEQRIEDTQGKITEGKISIHNRTDQ